MVHLENIDLKNKICAGVIGHAIGDALGVPVEFKERNELSRNPVHDMVGYGTHGMPVGTWSDDTSMEIALMQSIIDCEGFNYEDIMNNFYKWYRNGEFTATGATFDIGGTCASAIGNYISGLAPLESGKRGERSNGNGSLMRILPVAYICHEKAMGNETKYELVRNVSSLTHAHEISVLGCYIYVNFVCHLLDGDEPVVAYTKTQKDDYLMFSEATREVYTRVLTENIVIYSESEISSSGYVVSSLEASLWCLLNTTNYKQAVLKAVNLGNDTDTIGAITGSMAGICYGYGAIPYEWVEKLQRHDYLLRLCDEFATTIIGE